MLIRNGLPASAHCLTCHLDAQNSRRARSLTENPALCHLNHSSVFWGTSCFVRILLLHLQLADHCPEALYQVVEASYPTHYHQDTLVLVDIFNICFALDEDVDTIVNQKSHWLVPLSIISCVEMSATGTRKFRGLFVSLHLPQTSFTRCSRVERLSPTCSMLTVP